MYRSLLYFEQQGSPRQFLAAGHDDTYVEVACPESMPSHIRIASVMRSIDFRNLISSYLLINFRIKATLSSEAIPAALVKAGTDFPNNPSWHTQSIKRSRGLILCSQYQNSINITYIYPLSITKEIVSLLTDVSNV